MINYLKEFLNKNHSVGKNVKNHQELMKEVWLHPRWAPELEGFVNVTQFLHLPSFTIVRNPIDRVVSAWREKLGPLDSSDLLSEKVLFWVGK